MKLLSVFFHLFAVVSVSCSNQSQAPNSKTDTLSNKKSISDSTLNHSGSEAITCKELAYQILTSSGRFRELTKGLSEAVIRNGGSSYGIDLEGSPHPEADSALQSSKTYDFALHETYTDRNVTTARFSVDLAAGKLFEYNVAEDALAPVDFDKALLMKPHGCK